jgi:hypothetical protein
MSYDANYLVRILYACLFYKPHFISILAQRFFSNVINITVRVVKYACFLGTQNKRAVHRKITSSIM